MLLTPASVAVSRPRRTLMHVWSTGHKPIIHTWTLKSPGRHNYGRYCHFGREPARSGANSRLRLPPPKFASSVEVRAPIVMAHVCDRGFARPGEAPGSHRRLLRAPAIGVRGARVTWNSPNPCDERWVPVPDAWNVLFLAFVTNGSVLGSVGISRGSCGRGGN
jgi:hypothetical protein